MDDVLKALVKNLNAAHEFKTEARKDPQRYWIAETQYTAALDALINHQKALHPYEVGKAKL